MHGPHVIKYAILDTNLETVNVPEVILWVTLISRLKLRNMVEKETVLAILTNGLPATPFIAVVSKKIDRLVDKILALFLDYY